MRRRLAKLIVLMVAINVMVTVALTALINYIGGWHGAIFGFGTLIVAPALGVMQARWLDRRAPR